MNTVSTAFIDLVASVTRPLVGAGALNQTEYRAFIQILKEHAAGKNKQPEGSSVVTPEEASKILQVCRRTVLRMVQTKELEAFYLRPGSRKTLRIRRSSLDAVLAGEGVL